MVIASIYVRVSSGPQETDGTSLQSQEQRCRDYAQQHGYQILENHVYREVHTGVELWERPQLTRLREAIRLHQFEVVIAYAIDRLARDPVHLGVIFTEAEHHNVQIEFVSEILDTSPEAALIRFVRGYAAKVEHEKIRERTVRGKKARAEAGKLHNFGPELYGYRRDKKVGIRIVYEPEAATVRQIFQWVVEDRLSIRSIVRRLYQLEVPPPSHGKMTYPEPGRVPAWGHTQVHRVLTQPSYKGEPMAWRWSRRAKQRTSADWIRLPPETTPAIVSPQIWDAAQGRLKENRGDSTRNESRPFLLRGRVFCTVCGRAMRPGSNNGYQSYRCSSRETPSGACGGKAVPAERLETWVWQRVNQALKDPSIIAGERERRRQEGPDQRSIAEKESAERALQKLERQQEKLIRRYRESEDDSFPWQLIEREITLAEKEKEQVRQTLEGLARMIAEQEALAGQMDAIVEYCQNVAANVDDMDFSGQRLAVDALKAKVYANGADSANWHVRGEVPLAGVVSPTCS